MARPNIYEDSRIISMIDRRTQKGVKFSFFEKFIEDYGGRENFTGMTTADVNKKIIEPICRQTEKSACESGVCAGFVGEESTWFISHVWTYKFLDVVEAVGLALQRIEGQNYSEVVVWFDQFSLCHPCPPLQYEDLHDTFMEATMQIKNMMLIFDEWDAPKHLTRAWCVFELYAAIKTERRLELGMSTQAQQKFLDDIQADYNGERFNRMLTQINTSAIEARENSDKENISRCIEANVSDGFHGLDSNIREKLKELIKEILKTQCEMANLDLVRKLMIYNATNSINSNFQTQVVQRSQIEVATWEYMLL